LHGQNFGASAGQFFVPDDDVFAGQILAPDITETSVMVTSA
jgi:hypothetical protein